MQNKPQQKASAGDSKIPPVSPEIMRIASERHQKGLMHPWIYQLLSQVCIPIYQQKNLHLECKCMYMYFNFGKFMQVFLETNFSLNLFTYNPFVKKKDWPVHIWFSFVWWVIFLTNKTLSFREKWRFLSVWKMKPAVNYQQLGNSTNQFDNPSTLYSLT